MEWFFIVFAVVLVILLVSFVAFAFHHWRSESKAKEVGIKLLLPERGVEYRISGIPGEKPTRAKRMNKDTGQFEDCPIDAEVIVCWQRNSPIRWAPKKRKRRFRRKEL